MKKKGTICVHEGGLKDVKYGGAISPIYPSSAYQYENREETLYPRYYNLPNQRAVEMKMAKLENTEEAILFSSGMAAIMTVFLSFLKTGDHIILQDAIYGGTYDSVVKELAKFNIEVSFANGTVEGFKKYQKRNTKVIFIETPSNPLLKITDIESFANYAKENNFISVIDNTFASPINQNPSDFGIDISVHSGTKYLGGHSDICCGVATLSAKHKAIVRETAIHFGGSLDARTSALLERSLKTLELRVERQNANAMAIAEALKNMDGIEAVYYPGLKSHHDHSIAKNQMRGFGGMLSFEVTGNPETFSNKLKLIQPVISLGAVESTISSPVKTSHARVPLEERLAMGIKNNLLRLSVGIENPEDLIGDLEQALV